MKALTVQQPWAWAIIHGGKDVENRTQAWSYRGPLAIHAGLAKPEKHNLASRRRRELYGGEVPTDLKFGGFIGVVDLVDAHRALGYWTRDNEWRPGCCDSPWAECTYRDHAVTVHLELANARPLAQPIPCRGRLGLWTPPADVLEQLAEVSR